ncbi:hypothetical protein AAFF_G00000230 [Aldrovandia affinis]|uniref:RING-CH-type domain-containing protein n=1 Tax=Aldrovandia affinis TaxID=143900 RepID=A0AAD7TCQ6_9TELE|nr:hypothetical protein AAFF_G00000230 [Aldrovandia affinis]
MDNGYAILSNDITPDSCKVFITDVPECFICRDGERMDHDALLNFCDCKNLLAHHRCLLTWIKKGLGTEDKPKCSVCNAEYHLQRSPAWRSVLRHWQAWLVLAVTLALLGLVPYVVFRMMTAFQNPPPHSLFKAAAVCFGLLTETLLMKCLASYFAGRYQQAEQSSFTVQPRRTEIGEAGPGPQWLASSAGHGSSAAVGAQAGERKQGNVKANQSAGLKF